MNTTTTSMARRIAARRSIAACLLGAGLLVGSAAAHADENVTCTLKRALKVRIGTAFVTVDAGTSVLVKGRGAAWTTIVVAAGEGSAATKLLEATCAPLPPRPAEGDVAPAKAPPPPPAPPKKPPPPAPPKKATVKPTTAAAPSQKTPKLATAPMPPKAASDAASPPTLAQTASPEVASLPIPTPITPPTPTPTPVPPPTPTATAVAAPLVVSAPVPATVAAPATVATTEASAPATVTATTATTATATTATATTATTAATTATATAGAGAPPPLWSTVATGGAAGVSLAVAGVALTMNQLARNEAIGLARASTFDAPVDGALLVQQQTTVGTTFTVAVAAGLTGLLLGGTAATMALFTEWPGDGDDVNGGGG